MHGLNLLQSSPTESAKELAQEVKSDVQYVKQLFNTPLNQQLDATKNAMSNVGYWEDFAGALGAMFGGAAVTKIGATSGSVVTTTENVTAAVKVNCWEF